MVQKSQTTTWHGAFNFLASNRIFTTNFNRFDIAGFLKHLPSMLATKKTIHHQLEPRSRLHPKIKTLPFYADGRLLFAAIKKCLARLWSLSFWMRLNPDRTYQELVLFRGLKTELLNVSFVMVYYS